MTTTASPRRFVDLPAGMTRPRVPLPTLATAAAVVAVSTGLTLTRHPPPPASLLMHLLQLALAGAAAFLLDDAAAELTGVAPPPWWLRRAPQVVPGLAVLAGAWVVLLLETPDGPGAAASAFGLAVLVAVSLAGSAVVARQGEPEPGALVAPVVVLTGAGVLLAGGLLGFDVFLAGGDADTGALTVSWLALGALAVGVLVAANRDPAR